MSKVRAFQAKDGTDWLAFPHELVQILNDPSADGADPVVLVLDRDRAAALAVMAMSNRNILGQLAALMDAFKQVGIDENPIKLTREIGTDLARALDWDVSEADHNILEKSQP